ncbi:MAG TPA: hypothetical protein VN328_03765 [Thermodesulfovibrionales bacterium]|nr:hypothetical protein [Thermodesulfovibrionales bacterium]
MPYKVHPSGKLVSLFKEKPWQGNNPLNSTFVFVGLDANYAANIEKKLPEIFEYLEDGVAFWRQHKVHHPFRLPYYKGKGRKYHDKFAEIGFAPEHAETVSFLELLDVPTIGSQLGPSDLSINHLFFLADVFENGAAEYIFMYPGVVALLRRTRLFKWLPAKTTERGDALTVLREKEGQIIYQMYHFSCRYSRQVAVLDKHIEQVRNILERMERSK